jgi:hypothetical protein
MMEDNGENKDMTSGPYIIEHGDVWIRTHEAGKLDNGLRHVCGANDELAIAYGEDTIFKLGSASGVEAFMRKNAGSGFDITVVSFPVSEATVAELNACHANNARIRDLLENLGRIGDADPSISERPRFPK